MKDTLEVANGGKRQDVQSDITSEEMSEIFQICDGVTCDIGQSEISPIYDSVTCDIGQSEIAQKFRQSHFEVGLSENDQILNQVDFSYFHGVKIEIK